MTTVASPCSDRELLNLRAIGQLSPQAIDRFLHRVGRAAEIASADARRLLG